MATPLAATAPATTMITINSVVDELDDSEEAETGDAASSWLIPVADWEVAVVEEGGMLTVVDGDTVPAADKVTLVVVDGETVVVGFAVVVVGFAVVVVGFAVVVVGFVVVVVGLGLTVVVVAETWHPGLPWPAGGLHVLPGWAVTGPTNAHAVSPIATAKAIVAPNPSIHPGARLFPISNLLLLATSCSPGVATSVRHGRKSGPCHGIRSEARQHVSISQR
jgi:hypothetical protein